MCSPGLIGSNAVIREIAAKRFMVRQVRLRAGTFYCRTDNFGIVQRDIVERLIGKGILRPADDRPDHFALSEAWS